MRKSWAAAAGSQAAADAAAETLRAGGGAVDAVIAGALAACASEPALASLFGGGFLMARDARGATKLLDFFVQTPRGRDPNAGMIEVEADFGDARQTFLIGPASIACPGVAVGLAQAHDALGRMPFAELTQPAIAAARAQTVEPFQAEVAQIIACILGWREEGRRAFGFDGDAPPKPHAPLCNPALADLIDAYGREGARFMMEGEPGAALAEACREGGHLTLLDLKRYQPRWREPQIISRGDAKIALNPAPSTGGALIGCALALTGPSPSPAELARAFAVTARARLESGLDADAELGARRLSDPDWLAQIRAHPLAARGTTHISAIDPSGAGAALTLSNGAGSGVIVDGTGAMANNMLGELDLVPEPDAWPCDIRLSSMMAPSAVSWPDGRVAMLGSGGSNRIRTAITQALLHLIDDGAELETAIAAPRLHVEGWPGPALDFEDRFPEEDRAALLKAFPKGRPWARDSMFFGGVHAALRDAKGGVEAAGDPRRSGVAITG